MKPTETKRRSLPSIPPMAASIALGDADHPAERGRRGGPRHEVSERVAIRTETDDALEGWAINISRGGVRVLVEGRRVDLGSEVSLTIGTEAPQLYQRGRVVWTQDEDDGTIAGIAFLEKSA